MCLQALEQVVKPGARVFDVGTGSGILAIAAAKLGAGPILAIDIDEVAVKTAVENIAQNQVDHIGTRHGVLADVNEKGWDVVVVNILAPIIISLFQEDDLLSYVAPGGSLILSGIIDQQAEDVKTAVLQAGGTIQQILTVRDWVTLIVQHS
jgi:ribosomal protein L11 methyltransferase